MDPVTILGLLGSGLGLVKGLFGGDDEEEALEKQRREQEKLDRKRRNHERLMAARQSRASGGIVDPGSSVSGSQMPVRNEALQRLFGG